MTFGLQRVRRGGAQYRRRRGNQYRLLFVTLWFTSHSIGRWSLSSNSPFQMIIAEKIRKLEQLGSKSKGKVYTHPFSDPPICGLGCGAGAARRRRGGWATSYLTTSGQDLWAKSSPRLFAVSVSSSRNAKTAAGLARCLSSGSPASAAAAPTTMSGHAVAFAGVSIISLEFIAVMAIRLLEIGCLAIFVNHHYLPTITKPFYSIIYNIFLTTSIPTLHFEVIGATVGSAFGLCLGAASWHSVAFVLRHLLGAGEGVEKRVVTWVKLRFD